MTKDEAERLTLKLWREQPILKRREPADATAFAKVIAAKVQFDTLGNRERIIEAWLNRDLQRAAGAMIGLDKARAGQGSFTARK